MPRALDTLRPFTFALSLAMAPGAWAAEPTPQPKDPHAGHSAGQAEHGHAAGASQAEHGHAAGASQAEHGHAAGVSQAEHGHAAGASQASGGAIAIPASLREEHEAIHGELVRATKVKGRVGAAARELAGVLHDHFVREEQIALPPLGLIAPLSRGEYTPEMREVLAMTDALRAELPRMLQEHEKIAAAAKNLEQVARREGNARVEKLAKSLQLHAQGEEQLYYPAALLVGDVVRERSERAAAAGAK